MTSALHKIGRISSKQFKCIFLKKKGIFFAIFYWISEIYIKIWTFWKKYKPQSLTISEIMDSKKTCGLQTPFIERPSIVNVFTGPKYCWNLHSSTFTLLRHDLETYWVEKRLS